jgi:hypothetical protein
VSELSVGRPPHPPPRRITLGADAWVLLAEAITRAGAQLARPLRIEDGPALDDAQRAGTLEALHAAGLLRGESGDLLADLHPSVRESLLAHVAPPALVQSRSGLGDELRFARHALRGELACGLARDQQPLGDERVQLGPVELTAMVVDDLVEDILRGFGDLGGAPDREPLQLDAAVSLATVRALADERPDLAQAVLEQPAVPPTLRELAAGLLAVAEVAVAGSGGTEVLTAMRLADGWWTAALTGEDVVLDPVGEDELTRMIAQALAGAITATAPA